MARYPDIRSAVIPAMKVVQREHGWLSPTAMEQAACVLRLTPALPDLRRELLRHVRAAPQGRERTSTSARTSRARCSAPTPCYARMKDVLGGDPDFNVRAFECLGACEIAPMASRQRRLRRPADRGRLRADPRRRQGRAARSCGQATREAQGRVEALAGDRRDRQHRHDPLQGHRRAGPEHARRLPAPRRLRDAAQGADDGRAGTCSTRCSPPACAAAAAPASRWAARCPSSPRGRWRSTSSATPTSPSPGPSRTASSCRRTPTC